MKTVTCNCGATFTVSLDDYLFFKEVGGCDYCNKCRPESYSIRDLEEFAEIESED